MDMLTLAAFVVSFVIGPLICAMLMRLPRSLWVLITLALATCMTSALALQLRLTSLDYALWSLVLMWLAWVIVVALVALAVGKSVSTTRQRRWVKITALLTTTLPWFGLATARTLI